MPILVRHAQHAAVGRDIAAFPALWIGREDFARLGPGAPIGGGGQRGVPRLAIKSRVEIDEAFLRGQHDGIQHVHAVPIAARDLRLLLDLPCPACGRIGRARRRRQREVGVRHAASQRQRQQQQTNSHAGTRTRTAEPRPGRESTTSCPPSPRTRRRIDAGPMRSVSISSPLNVPANG